MGTAEELDHDTDRYDKWWSQKLEASKGRSCKQNWMEKETQKNGAVRPTLSGMGTLKEWWWDKLKKIDTVF